MRLLARLLIWVWPFLLSVIFNDRPVMEVIGKNRLFTVIFVLLVIVAGFLFYTTNALALSKARAVELRQQVSQLEQQNARLRADPSVCPPPPPYNADRIIQQLFQ